MINSLRQYHIWEFRNVLKLKLQLTSVKQFIFFQPYEVLVKTTVWKDVHIKILPFIIFYVIYLFIYLSINFFYIK